MKKYAWLNLETGQFSNSWVSNSEDMKELASFPEIIKDGYRLIEFECLNDPEFEFSCFMRLR